MLDDSMLVTVDNRSPFCASKSGDSGVGQLRCARGAHDANQGLFTLLVDWNECVQDFAKNFTKVSALRWDGAIHCSAIVSVSDFPVSGRS